MKLGLLKVELYIPNCNSLKAKRGIIKRHIHYLRSHFNVAIAEIDKHDKHRSCQLAITTVYNGAAKVEQTLRQVVQYFERCRDVTTVDYGTEII